MGGAALEVLIGLVFVWFVFSLVCSGIHEWIAVRLNWRGAFLLKGIRSMLEGVAAGTPGVVPGPKRARSALRDLFSFGQARHVVPGDGLAAEVVRHPLVTPAADVGTVDRTQQAVLPSYVSSRSFARALLAALQVPEDAGQALAQIRATSQGLPDLVKRPLLALLTDAERLNASVEDKMAAFEQSVEKWFDDQMDRVSGWYKRRTRLVLLLLGIVVTGLFNVDSVAVARTLFQDDDLRAAVVAQAEHVTDQLGVCPTTTTTAADDVATTTTTAAPEDGTTTTSSTVVSFQCAREQLDELDGLDLPLGWNPTTNPGWDLAGIAVKAVGLLITAGALSFGAQFWFDALNQLVSLRKTGAKPARADEPT
jgi:hypothetical protein